MTSMFFGVISDHPVPADENVVRRNTAPVQNDAPAAMQDDAPDKNEFESDSNPEIGLTTRTLASTWHDGEKGSPEWIGQQDNDHLHADLVNARISNSGTAAAREAAGAWGHGTLKFAVGIEPTSDLVDGGKFGNDYFAVDKPNVQDGMGNYMTQGPGQDHAMLGALAATGKTAARDAAVSAVYNSWYLGSTA